MVLGELLSVVVGRFLVVGQAIRVSLVPWTGFAMVASELTAVELVVTVQNAYSDGYQSEQTLTVQLDSVGDEEDLWEQLCDHTGDGHGIGRDLDGIYEMTVLACAQRPELVGLSNEWG